MLVDTAQQCALSKHNSQPAQSQPLMTEVTCFDGIFTFNSFAFYLSESLPSARSPLSLYCLVLPLLNFQTEHTVVERRPPLELGTAELPELPFTLYNSREASMCSVARALA